MQRLNRRPTSRARRAVALLAVAAAGIGVTTTAVARPGVLVKNHHYVTKTFGLDPSDSSSKTSGFDLDGDHKVDNQLAKIFGAMTAQNLDVSGAIQSAIDSGAVVMLHSLRTGSLFKTQHATWRVFQGKPKASPDFSGAGHFKVDPAAPTGKPLKGHIRLGVFTGKRGVIPLQLALFPGQAPVQLNVIDAHLRAKCTATACTHAKLGGAIRRKALNQQVIPAVATALNDYVQASCGGNPPDGCSDDAKQLLQIYDANNDYVISVHEVRSNGLTQALFAPDVDLFKADGTRGTDGTKDSLSLGFAFTAVGAHFTQP